MLQNYEESEYMIYDTVDNDFISTIYANSISTNKNIDSALKFDSFELADGMAIILKKRGDLTKYCIVKRCCSVEVIE